MLKVLITRVLVLVGLISAPYSYAALTIEITDGVEGALPIAVVPFDTGGIKTPLSYKIDAIIAADLARSGRFDPMPEKDLIARPHDGGSVRFGDWRLVNQESLVVGRVKQLGASRYEVLVQLFDVFKG